MRWFSKSRTASHTQRRLAASCLAGTSGALGLLWLCGSAHAVRPQTTEDAGLNPPGTCQFEVWQDQARDGHHAHQAPVCGVLPDLELGAESVHSIPSKKHLEARALSLKWVPDWAQWQDWQFGLKGGALSQKPVGSPHWHAVNWSAMLLATHELSHQWTLHINLGHIHDIDQHGTVTNINASLNWRPHPRWLIFAEVLGDTRTASQKGGGLRWWLLQDRVAVDVTAARNGNHARTSVWGIGLGWYGITF